jgi:outer membrane receptor protein involved in Fe transport
MHSSAPSPAAASPRFSLPVTASSPRHLLRGSAPGILLLSLALVSGAHGQVVAPPSPEGETVVLSPFVVASSSDVGYEASRSLAGTGLNTRLTDLGSSVSVITAKFLEDTASLNLRDLLVYQTNMEAGGFGGNISGTNPAPGGISGEPSLSAGIPDTRVRGLAAATNARNFFRNNLPMDSYNTERVEINRGANALLFGVGSPAGIINTTTAAANLQRSFGNVELSIGSHDTNRVVLRYNQVLLPDELAIRFAGLRNRQQFQQKFTFTDDDRIYLAGAWDIKALRKRGILTSTTLRASMEDGKIESNRPRVLTPSDRLSSWFDATLPENLKALGAKGKVTYDPRNGPFNVFNRPTQTATIGVIDNVNRSPTFVFQDVNATAPRDNVPINAAGQTVLGRGFVSNNVYYPSTNKTGIAVAAYSRELNRVRADYGMPDQTYYTAENLTDPGIFDFFNNTLVGPNSEGLANLRAIDVSLEQLMFDRTAGVEISHSSQQWDEGLQSLLPQGSPYITIDVNTHMWTGEVNPNFGRPFISTAGRASYNETVIETTRAKAFYDLDLPDRMRNRVGWFLGRHIVSALVQREVLNTDQRGGGYTHYTPDFWANGGGQSRNAAQGKGIVSWVYLGDSLKDATSPAGANLQGLQQNLLNFQDEVNNKGVVIGRLQAPNAAAARLPEHQPFFTPITVLREDRKVTNTAQFANLAERTLDSQALALQSHWLGDHLVSTVGWRKEESSILSTPGIYESTGQSYVLVNDPSYSLNNPALVAQEFDKTLFAWSVVAKTPNRWLERVPHLSTFNVYYGESENFTPPQSRTVNAFGGEVAPPSGETKEVGVYVEAFDARIATRVNFFETIQTGDFNTTVGNIAGAIMQMVGQVNGMVRGGSLPNAGNGFPPGFIMPPQVLLDTFNAQVQPNGTFTSSNPGVRDTSDFVTKGMEVEMTYRPTRGLSFIFNVGKQESARSNTGAATRRLLYDTPTSTGQPLAVEWKNNWALQIPINAGAIGKEGSNDINILANNFQALALNTYNVAASADGAPLQELRKWRANLVGSYQFQQERLRGFGVGVGVRWQDKAAIGFPVIDFTPPGSLTAQRVSDVRNPFYGPAETRYDAWISYERKMFDKQIPMRLQLNVRNLNINDELVPTVINPDGKVAVWSIAESRRITLTARFSF